MLPFNDEIFIFFAVATGFPAGLTGLSSRLAEIKIAVDNGASEIDVVIVRGLALAESWKGSCKLGVTICYIAKARLN